MQIIDEKPFDKEGFLILVSMVQFLACGGIFDYFLIAKE
jgi:hypothetical protein